ncbi:MAG: DUF1501 domain-containing protein [Planctomycetota bacterium]
MPEPDTSPIAIGRRGMLTRCGMGFGSMALAGMLNADAAESALGAESPNPMLPKPAQFPSNIKHVIHLFMNGGPSQVDTFDPKPELQRRGGQTISDGNLTTERPTGALFPSPYRFHRYGQSGIEVSELFPHVAQHVDDMAIIRSMHADVPNRPELGSHCPCWIVCSHGYRRLRTKHRRDEWCASARRWAFIRPISFRQLAGRTMN